MRTDKQIIATFDLFRQNNFNDTVRNRLTIKLVFNGNWK